MKLKYELTIEDKIDYQLFLIEHSKYLRRTYMKVRCLTVLGTFVMLLVCFSNRNMAMRLTAATFGGLITYPVSLLYTQFRISNAVRKLSDESKKNDPLADIVELNITEEGLAYQCYAGNGIMNWTALTSIERTPELTCLMISSTNGFPISPDHILEGDFNTFLTEVDPRLGVGK